MHDSNVLRCPVCGGEQHTELFRSSNGYPIVRCQGCQLAFTDDRTAADTTQVLHRPNRIRVEKTPGNASTPPQYTPNGTVPYVLRVTNTGQWPMTGFEVVDQIGQGRIHMTPPPAMVSGARVPRAYPEV